MDETSPGHYTVGGIETVDFMRAKSTPAEFQGYCKLNALKYISRMGHKGPKVIDAQKAMVYLGWLVESLAEEERAKENENDE